MGKMHGLLRRAGGLLALLCAAALFVLAISPAEAMSPCHEPQAARAAALPPTRAEETPLTAGAFERLPPARSNALAGQASAELRSAGRLAPAPLAPCHTSADAAACCCPAATVALMPAAAFALAAPAMRQAVPAGPCALTSCDLAPPEPPPRAPRA